MQLDRLRYFHAVARAGSFTKAARALRVSQPSLSKTVRLLEEHEGVKLLDRTGRKGVELTPAGRRFVASCEVVFAELDRLRQSVIAEREECVGPLALGASDNVCNYLMAALLTPFLARHPKVTTTVFSGTSDAIAKELLENGAELGIFYTKPRDARLVAEPLAFVEFVVVSRSRLARRDLVRIPYVGSRSADYVKRYPALQMLASLGVRPTVVIATNNQETQKRLALAGLGYTVVPRFMVRRELERGEAAVVPAPKRIGSHLFLVTRKGRTLSSPAERFGEHLHAMIPGLVGGE